MASIDAWQGNAFPLADWLDDVDRATDTARLIADKSTSITPIRGGLAQSATTVRIEFLARPREVQGEGGQTALVDVLVVGYKGHAEISDSDLRRGDRFTVAGVAYEIVVIAPGFADMLQAYARVRS